MKKCIDFFGIGSPHFSFYRTSFAWGSVRRLGEH